MSFVAVEDASCDEATCASGAGRSRVEYLWEEIRAAQAREERLHSGAQLPGARDPGDRRRGGRLASSWRCGRATSTPSLVVFCGVRFMAEGCYTLGPADARLSAQPAGAVLAGRGRCGRGGRAAGVSARAGRRFATMTYVNTYADVKALSDSVLHELERRQDRRRGWGRPTSCSCPTRTWPIRSR